MKKKPVVLIFLMVVCLFCIFACSSSQEKKREKLVGELERINEYFRHWGQVGKEELAEYKKVLIEARDAGVDVTRYEDSIPEKEVLAIMYYISWIGVRAPLPSDLMPSDRRMARAEKLFSEIRQKDIYYTDSHVIKDYVKIIEGNFFLIKVRKSLQDLWAPILYGDEPPSQERLKEIETILAKYDGPPIVKINIGMTPELLKVMKGKYPMLEKEMYRIYHSLEKDMRGIYH